MPEIRTDRLLLRSWRDSDGAPWAAMNADPVVREHLGGPLTREQSTASIARFQADLEARGWGWWAVQLLGSGEFIGFAGLDPADQPDLVNQPGSEDQPGSVDRSGSVGQSGAVEVGWRLARAAWGHGYATEAARACLGVGFRTLGLAEILALTVTGNLRSQAVMRRIGMTHDPADDFDDHTMPPGPLRRTVVFRIGRERFAAVPGQRIDTARPEPGTARQEPTAQR